LAQAIISGEYEFHEKYWDEISKDAKDMISNLLQVDPEIRLTADDALQCPWMTLEDEALNTKDLSTAQRAIKDRAPETGASIPAAGGGGKFGSLGLEFTTSLVNFIDIETRERLTTAAAPQFESITEDEPLEIIEDSSSGKAFEVLYKWGREIGAGQYTVVHEAKHRKSREIYAVKRVARTDLGPSDAVALQDEITALQMVSSCPQIVNLHDVFEEPDHTFLVLESMRGGDLIKRIEEKEHYNEVEAREVAKQLLLGVEYCHNKRIANRNLKPENILLVSSPLGFNELNCP
jgi:serine/threonine protein kinase